MLKLDDRARLGNVLKLDKRPAPRRARRPSSAPVVTSWYRDDGYQSSVPETGGRNINREDGREREFLRKKAGKNMEKGRKFPNKKKLN